MNHLIEKCIICGWAKPLEANPVPVPDSDFMVCEQCLLTTKSKVMAKALGRAARERGIRQTQAVKIYTVSRPSKAA